MLVEGNYFLRWVEEEMMESWGITDVSNDLRKDGVFSEYIRHEGKESIGQKMRELDARE